MVPQVSLEPGEDYVPLSDTDQGPTTDVSYTCISPLSTFGLDQFHFNYMVILRPFRNTNAQVTYGTHGITQVTSGAYFILQDTYVVMHNS